MIGLVLDMYLSLVKEEVTILFTQAVEMKWDFKIGAHINQVTILHMTVSAP